MALLSDAGHNLSDVASLLLAMLAYRLAKTKPTATLTYGYRKSTVLVSLINAVVLLIAVGSIIWESISSLQHPEIINGKNMAVVAGIGIVINTITAFLFLNNPQEIFIVEEIINFNWQSSLKNTFIKTDIINKKIPICKMARIK